MPPSPFGPAPIAPVSHVPMMPPHAYVQPAAYQPMPMQQPTPGMHIEELIKALQESLYPAQREMAAQSLMNFDWRAHPQIVPALLGAARQDPAASVRAGCVSCLGRMGASVGPVMSTLQSMRNDIDPRVRQEVDAALVRLGQATR
jgi:hypothetical protein